MESTPSAEARQPTILPEFLIGVTGHRDILDSELDRLRQQLRDVVQEVGAHLPNIPVRIACGLAEGADTVAAEIALELGLKVSAILPMPTAEYQKDFDGEALAKYQNLIANPSVEVAEIPIADPNAVDRDHQYSLLADYLVRRSNVIFAVWDGENKGLPGGTSDVVMRYLCDGQNHDPNLIDLMGMDAEGCGNAVAWFPVKRASGESAPDRNSVTYLISNAEYDCFWQTSTVPQLILNRWIGFDAYFEERNSDQGRDLPGYGLEGTDEFERSSELACLDAEFIRADQIARSYQSRSHLMFALFGMLAAAMGLAFLIYAKLLADKYFLYAYIGLFAAGFLGFRYTRRMRLHSKHLAYRALAETFRVQYFLILSGAGANYNPRRILGLTSVDQFQRFEWLQEAIRISEPVVYSGHCNEVKILDTVSRNWISDQLGYFQKKQHALHHQHHRLETMKFALLIGSVIGALALIFFKKPLIHLEMMGYDGKAWLVFLMGLLPLWAAIWELYQGKMATRELLWQYANQTKYFRAAEHEIRQARNLIDGQQTIRDLADKALIEIYMWSVHRFHREHEPPAAG